MVPFSVCLLRKDGSNSCFYRDFKISVHFVAISLRPNSYGSITFLAFALFLFHSLVFFFFHAFFVLKFGLLENKLIYEMCRFRIDLVAERL